MNIIKSAVGFFSTCALLVAIPWAVQAAPVLSTDFNVTTKSAASQDMTNIIWTEDAAITANTTITTTANANAGYHLTGFGATGFAPDQNIGNEGPWSATINFSVAPNNTVDLSSIAFDFQMVSNSGADQAGAFPNSGFFDILVDGSAFGSTVQDNGPSGSHSILDTVTLAAGNHSIVITASSISSTGNNIGIDNLLISGTATALVVPEPSSLLLFGVVGLVGLGVYFMRRRLKSASFSA